MKDGLSRGFDVLNRKRPKKMVRENKWKLKKNSNGENIPASQLFRNICECQTCLHLWIFIYSAETTWSFGNIYVLTYK